MSEFYNKQARSPALWKLILLCSTAAFFALMPVNTIRLIQQHFAVSANISNGVLSWFLMGYGLGPLLYAPISNRFGRKKALYFGFSIALVSAVLSIVALWIRAFDLLLITRLLTGVGASVGLVVGMIMIADTADAVQSRKLFSIIILFFSFSPSLAIFVGGLLAKYFGIDAMFYAMAGVLLVWLYLISTLDETAHRLQANVNPLRVVRQYVGLFSERSFIFSALLMALASSLMYVFNGMGPIIAERLHVSTIAYGNMVLLPAIGMFVGAILSSRLSARLSVLGSLFLGLGLITLSLMAMTWLFFSHQSLVVTYFVPGILMFLGVAIVIPNASMNAVSSASDSANASSVMTALSLMLSGVSVSVCGLLIIHHSMTVVPLYLIATLIAAYVLACLLAGGQQIFSVNDDSVEEILV